VGSLDNARWSRTFLERSRDSWCQQILDEIDPITRLPIGIIQGSSTEQGFLASLQVYVRHPAIF
jgi:hypothetical protein